MFFGTVNIVNYVFPREKTPLTAMAIVFVTGVLGIVGYLMASKIAVILVVLGLAVAAILWEGGPIVGNVIFLITEKGTYSIIYNSRSEIKTLISVLGGGNEG